MKRLRLSRFSLTLLAITLLVGCSVRYMKNDGFTSLKGTPSVIMGGTQVKINRQIYIDQIQGFYLGSCIANWTGLTTEGERKTYPYFRDEDWGSNLGRNWQKIQFILDQDPWQSDDDTDIEYIFQHAHEFYKTSKLTGDQIRAQWLEHISSNEENYLWVANEVAFHLMEGNSRMKPPATSNPHNNHLWEMIDAQLTTEIFGVFAPVRIDVAKDIAWLPIRTTAYSHSEHASQFYVMMHSLASAVDKNLPMRDQILWLADQARANTPEYSYIAAMYDWIRGRYMKAKDKNDWERVRDAFHFYYILSGKDNYKYRGWVDSGSNFGMSIISLLFGEGDFARTIQIGTLAGLDSDNPTATWGGLLGFMLGRQGLSDYWGREFSDDFNIARTRINFPPLDNFADMAERAAGVVDLVVVEQMGGKIENGHWLIPTEQTIFGNNLAQKGKIVASTMSPTGIGNPNINVIKDGIKADVGSSDQTLQYDTYEGSNSNEAYIGYVYEETKQFSKVVFQEGIHLESGGWFGSGPPLIQVRQNGNWNSLDVEVSPDYPVGNSKKRFGPNYETYTWKLNASGDGIRLYGVPGGDAKFISIGEFEVY